MSATLPRIVPSTLVAGDTLQFNRPGGDYPPTDGWTLNFSFVGSGGAVTFAATADGDDYAINVPASTTKAWMAGTYIITEYVTNAAGDRHTISSQPLVIQANLAAATVATDTRTHVQKMLDIIEAYMEAKDPGAAEVQIGSRRLRYYSVAELIQLRDKYKAAVLAEARKGNGRRPRILSVIR